MGRYRLTDLPTLSAREVRDRLALRGPVVPGTGFSGEVGELSYRDFVFRKGEMPVTGSGPWVKLELLKGDKVCLRCPTCDSRRGSLVCGGEVFVCRECFIGAAQEFLRERFGNNVIKE